MTDSLFPSGEWTGFYNYRPGDRHRMDLRLTFASGLLSGEGRDDIGAFLIRGRYDPTARECHWTKSYLGAHDVYYRGFREGKGIWGTWEIGIRCHGGFHIWPRATGGEAAVSAEERAELVEALGRVLEESAVAGKTDAPKIQDPRSKIQGRSKHQAPTRSEAPRFQIQDPEKIQPPTSNPGSSRKPRARTWTQPSRFRPPSSGRPSRLLRRAPNPELSRFGLELGSWCFPGSWILDLGSSAADPRQRRPNNASPLA